MSAAVGQPALLDHAPTYYGCRVAEIGEDSEYAVTGPGGHVPPRRALAAVLRYLRVDCGIERSGIDRWFDEPRFADRWLVYVRAGDLDGESHGWTWADDDARQPITVVEL